MGKTRLRGFTQNKLEALMDHLGQPRYRATQLAQWIYQKGVEDFALMTNFPKELREKLEEEYSLLPVPVVRKQVSTEDGTRKYLLQMEDASLVETVLLPQEYGHTVCVSSQVGCHMGCKICASTLGGLVRNLEAGEMFEQVWVFERELRNEGKRVSHVVVMGTGEPLENFTELLTFLSLLNFSNGLNISYRNITVSTCGLVPQIIKLAKEKLPITLAISLHSADDTTRSKLVPINKRYPLNMLIEACKFYFEATGRRITYEYALIKGVNDSVQDAKRLAGLLKGQTCHVNLIPVNPVKETGTERPEKENIQRFFSVLEGEGIAVTLRREMGTDIDAACGQLRWKVLKENDGNLTLRDV